MEHTSPCSRSVPPIRGMRYPVEIFRPLASDEVQSPPSMQNESKPIRTPLPTALPALEGLDFHARYYSSRTGGDFYDAVAAGPHVVFFLTNIAGSREEAHTIAAAVQDAFRSRVPQLFT